MNHGSLRSLLVGAQVVGVATLLRSVAFDRWITVLASLLLVVGATAALRGRTWGVALSFASAVAFPVAWAIGIAPFWFLFVGIIGALPFVLASGALARFDRKATALLASLAVGMGAAGAIGWKLVAWDAFRAFPSLWPSVRPQHPIAVTALLVLGMIAIAFGSSSRRAPRAVSSNATPERVRIGGVVETTSALDVELEAEREGQAEADDERRALGSTRIG